MHLLMKITQQPYTLIKMQILKRVTKKIELWFDIYFVYFLYNDKKLNRYYEYMRKKWGSDI